MADKLMKSEFNFSAIERKWQKKWEEKKIYEVDESKKKKHYILEMYPYPSASGLHIGHAFNYVIGDIYARFKRMQGFNVLHPMGFDSFGLPAENAAIKEGIHPKKYTENAINNFIKQQKSLGLSYDWSRKLQSHDHDYYKWNQFFFLQFLKKGLAYRKKAAVNWCEKCQSVLANEQVHNGKCWRHIDTEINIKQLEQWFLKITDYADELLSEIDKLDWPERIKIMQRNWIGKSSGSEILFKINREKWPIFTTRPDTLFGVTFMVISSQHPRLMELVTKERKKDVEKFLNKISSVKQEDIEKLEKEGVFIGSYAINPINGEKIPVWAGNFVVADYGAGMVMGVPAHDSRDFEFAKKYKLPVKLVIKPEDKKIDWKNMKEAYEGAGILINSEGFNGLFSEEAKEHITIALKEKGLGRKVINYKLRDWLISRQRYWGTPIPVIYCSKCGIVPVPEKELPVLLPEKVKFGGGNPLETNKEFINVKCYKCGGKARRETDTMDTFFDSSWYFLRFTDLSKKEPFEKKKTEYWMPVDFYIGGAEHAIMHLIYARFFTKVLRDLGFLKINEPFKRLFNQGMVHGEDGAVMSKSKGNVIDPMEVAKKHGADALRLFLVSMASPDKDTMWNNSGLEGSAKFLRKIPDYFLKIKIGKSSKRIESKINKTIKLINEEFEYVRYNLAVIKIRELFDVISQENEIARKDLEGFIKILSPICPHIAEELWEKTGRRGFVSLAKWPSFDEKKIDEKIEETEKAIEKTIDDIRNIKKVLAVDKFNTHLYVVPPEVKLYKDAKESIKFLSGSNFVEIHSTADKHAPDPQGKMKKAKPSKPGIYIEPVG